MISCVAGFVSVSQQGSCGPGSDDGGEAERLRRVVAGLELEFVEAHAAAVEARRRAGLQAAELESGGDEAGGERFGARLAHAPAGHLRRADVDEPAKEGAGGEDDGAAADFNSAEAADANGLRGLRAALDEQRLGGRLEEREVRLLLDPALHRGAVRGAVVLRPRRADRRALAGVEHAELDAGLVGDLGHLAAERVNFADELALRQAADGRIAGHLADLVGAEGDQERAAAHPRRRQRRLAAGVSGADDDDVEGISHASS